jgi:hypothetical protein
VNAAFGMFEQSSGAIEKNQKKRKTSDKNDRQCRAASQQHKDGSCYGFGREKPSSAQRNR